MKAIKGNISQRRDNINVTVSEFVQKELLSITKKENSTDAIKELLKRELVRKRNKHAYQVKVFEEKYAMDFKGFEKKWENQKMDFATEKDFFDWDMAVTVLEDIEEEFRGIE